MVEEHPIWYALRDWDVGMNPQPEGVRQTGEIQLITRWRKDVMTEAFSGDINAQTGHAFIGWYLRVDGVTMKITEAEELPRYGRRRFMMLTCEYRT